MGLINIPTVPEAEKGIEQAEDHLLQGVAAEVASVRQQVEEILADWEVVVSFRKKAPATPAASPMGTPQ
jgi:hypothetical protein